MSREAAAGRGATVGTDAPRPRLNRRGAALLVEALVRAFAHGGAGVAPDPHGLRPRDLGPSLDNLAVAIRAEIAAGDASPADSAADPRGRPLAPLLTEVERLAALTHGWPGADTAAQASAQAPADPIRPIQEQRPPCR